MSKVLRQDDVLSLGWGGTVYSATQSLSPLRNSGISVVSLSGGLPRSAIINPYDNAASFAKILDAQCYYVTAPMYADDEATKKALMRSSAIRTVVDKAANADIALLTTIDLTSKTWIMFRSIVPRRSDEKRHGILLLRHQLNTGAGLREAAICRASGCP